MNTSTAHRPVGEPAHDLSGGSPGGHDWNLLDAGMAGRQRDGPAPPFLDSGEPDGDRIPRRYGDTARIRLQHAQRSGTLSVGLQPDCQVSLANSASYFLCAVA